MEKEEKKLSFVIVGHVDHGKSTLIGRLLFDTDSLPPDKIKEIEETSKELGREVEFSFLLDHLEEERKQGITIDTTQTFFKTEKRDYVIIDAPGHVEFVKNMVTGSSQAEAGILIIDVTEGLKEQSRRHAYILSLLGISQVAVALNKMDIVQFNYEKYEEIKKETEEFLKTIGIKAISYIPISALKGDNVAKRSEKMDWYKGPTVIESLDSFKNIEFSKIETLVLPIQDVYKIGSKRIIVGRIETGELKKGDEIEVLPTKEKSYVNTIEKFPKEVEIATFQESIGLTLKSPLFVERGMVICHPSQKPKQSDTFNATIIWMDKTPFNKSENLTLKCTTQKTICRIEKIHKRINSSTLEVIEENADKLENLEVGEVEIKTKKPIVIEKFNTIPELGRFVLVRENICAGGLITDINGE